MIEAVVTGGGLAKTIEAAARFASLDGQDFSLRCAPFEMTGGPLAELEREKRDSSRPQADAFAGANAEEQPSAWLRSE